MLKEVEKYLEEQSAKKNADIVKDYVKEVENDDGNLSNLKLWKLKQKLLPRSTDTPMAKKDENGNLVTAPEALKALYLKTYQKRLSRKPMKNGLLDIFFLKEELWDSRMKELSNIKTPPWSKAELRKAIKSLKKNKTSDPDGFINELFMDGCAGDDLENALLLLFNGIKNNCEIPEFMIKQNITTIYKNKGSRQDMENDRGIFILSSLKKILDKLIYLDKFKNIDSNMSCSNVGARKGRNIRDHLFIIYGIINSVVKGNEPSIDIQIYDLVKAFDSLWLEDCLNDTFDTLDNNLRDEKLKLLYDGSKKNLVAINTAVGLTDRVSIDRLVQQGSTWGPLLCSNTMDTLGKKVRDKEGPAYMYKGTVRILPLAMIDDINGISKCGMDSITLNTFINAQIELKKLKFHQPNHDGKSKCHKMHIGGNKSSCSVLKVHGTEMEAVEHDIYLGDVISNDGKNKLNIEKRISKGLGIISQIMNILDIITFGSHYIEVALLLRESMFINGILFNSEVWYGLSRAEMNDLEDLDRTLLRRILSVPVTTPKEALYLELGLIPISEIIRIRRIMYLHHLVTRGENKMLYQFFITQWMKPNKGDWTETIKEDLKEYNISEDLDYIKSKSKYSFKNLVKKRGKEYTLGKLLLQKEKHSKMRNLEYSELIIQECYLLPGLRVDQARNIFKFRTRMAQFGENYRGNKDNILCPLCHQGPDNQNHCFKCEIVTEKIDVKGVDMDDIYTNNISIQTSEILTKILELRKNIQEGEQVKKQQANEAQVHPIRSAASNTAPCMYY